MKKRTHKSILYTIIALALPTVVEQILETVVQYVDTAMVGHLGEQATAAVSVTTTINWLLHSLMSAFGVGLLALIAKAVGEKNYKDVRKLSVLAVWIILILGVIEGCLAMALSSYIPGWMGSAPDIQPVASRYFFIVSIPMVFRAASVICGAALRASGDTKTPMKITATANVVNIVLNYALIYGMGLGVTGAAIASAVSYTVGGICMFAVFFKKDLFRLTGADRVPDREILGKCLKISIPAAMTGTAACLGYVVFAGLVSGMGTVVFAAHSIAVTAETIFYIPGYGMSTAVSTLVGFSLGEGDQKKFKTVSHLSIALTIGLMCISGFVLYFTAEPFMRIFTPNQDVIQLGARMLRIVAFTEPFFGLMIIMQGIYNGLGKTGYAFWVETGSMWGIRIFFTVLCVKVWHLDLNAVWYCMIADNIIKALLYAVGYPRLGKVFQMKSKKTEELQSK